jgi:hypothetical protein
LDVLNWWFNSGLELKYSTRALHTASQSENNTNVLEWWKNSGLPLKYDELSMHYASQSNNIVVLEWWKKSGLLLKYFDIRSKNKKDIDPDVHYKDNVLAWWENSGLSFEGHTLYSEWFEENLMSF